MPTSVDFVCPLANGLHARPASHLAELARRFAAQVTVVNGRTGRSANARSVLELVGTDTRAGDACRAEISGVDEHDAALALQRFVGQELAACDEPLAISEPAAAVVIPRSLRAAGLAHFETGVIACPGLGGGRAVSAGGFAVPPLLATERPAAAAVELARFADAAEQVARDLELALRTARGATAGIIRAHLAILHDPALTDHVTERIQAGRSAGQAIADALERQRTRLASVESAYVRERVLDLEDIVGRLWEKILGGKAASEAVVLREPSIVFAATLTPSQFLALDRTQLRGIVLEHGGQTSHAVILARSYGVPTVTGVAGAAALGRTGATVQLDAYLGILIRDPGAEVCRYYEREAEKRLRLAAATQAHRDRPATTADGRRLEVGANIASVEEARVAFANGAEGIGLFRTELLFADRSVAPGEDEQYELYAAVARLAGDRPVIIRTLDIGGDKPVPFLSFPAEANPFLGYRGVRFYAEHAGLIKAQLRALLRAAAHGPIKILVPMIASVEEARLVRRLLAEARTEAETAGHALGASVPLGFMLEVPAVAYLLDELCAEADFFSIGTNDLAQYLGAADRENPKVAALNSPFQPALLRLLKQIVDGVRRRGRWIGLCGEMAEKPAALPLLVGLGLDEISLAAPRIGATKAALAGLTAESAGAFLSRVLAAATRDDVAAIVADPPRVPLPLLAAELVLDDVVATSKADVIRQMIDALHLAGRTDDPNAIEEAVWRREDTYSTGFGEGFALPHGKTDALRANSIVVARLRQPVEWQAMDGAPVDVVILLAIRESQHGKVHLQTLAQLSRLIMREEFRAALRAERTTAGILALLANSTQPRHETAA